MSENNITGREQNVTIYGGVFPQVTFNSGSNVTINGGNFLYIEPSPSQDRAMRRELEKENRTLRERVNVLENQAAAAANTETDRLRVAMTNDIVRATFTVWLIVLVILVVFKE